MQHAPPPRSLQNFDHANDVLKHDEHHEAFPVAHTSYRLVTDKFIGDENE
jgi:hypothetical protein